MNGMSMPIRAALFLLSGLVIRAVEPSVPAILTSHCAACHNPGNRGGGLDVTSRTKLIEGGDRGPGLIPGRPEEGLVMKRIRHEAQPGMPMGQPKLAPETIQRIEQWIRDGAPFESPAAAPAARQAAPSSDHWAFRKPVRPAVPTVNVPGFRIRNEVDSFLASDWRKHGLKPAPELDRRLLLRRVYLDLTGLPPTPEETRSFLEDRSANAYENAVDRLLGSTRYGERWGRHWMDVWRYSDWYGRRLLGDQRFSHRHVWRWRDWIVESLNDDRGYDRMIREMIAGDEIAPDDPYTLRATGYLVRSFHRFNRNVWLQDTVEHIGFGMLGLTVKCARCHDHKYDPIAQEDYYRLRAFFEPYDVRLDRVPGQSDTFEDGLARVFDAPPRKGGIEPYFPPIYKDTFRFIRGDETNPDKTPLSPGIPPVLGTWEPKIEPVKLSPESFVPDSRPFVRDDLITGAKLEVRNAETALETARRLLAEAREHAAKPWQAPAKSNHEPTVSYANDIASIFTLRCRQCHGGLGRTIARSGLSVASVEAMLIGGWKHGPAIVPGDAAASPIYRHITGTASPVMPAEGQRLTAEQVDKIRRWIVEMAPQDPRDVMKLATQRLALAEKHLETMRAAVFSLEARIAADLAKFKKAEDAAKLAKDAAKAEQRYAMAQAVEVMLEAQHLLSDEKAAAAKRKLEAAAAALAQGAEKYTPVMESHPETSTGRRRAFAEWLTGDANPLTARVAVNHIWLRHFGKPIVPTVTNFGRNGKPPVNQPLLDWLAVEFTANGWSMKKMHRLLVTSSAYRMASAGAGLPAESKTGDPENKHFWRMNARRMEAEVVRDAALFLAGVLDEKVGGPDIDEEEGMRSRRRSLYLRQTPESQVEFLRLFDQPNPTDCYMRTESVMPQQALAVANSTLYLEAARLLARRIAPAGTGDAEFARRVFELLTSQAPSKAELDESVRFLSDQAALFSGARLTRFSAKQEAAIAPSSGPRERARESFVHAMLNHNEFVTVR